MPDNYYQILDVSPEATPEEIKLAYRRQAMKHHPDRNADDPAAAERFKAVAEAYRILSDPDERAAYDDKQTFDRVYADAPELAAMRRHVRVSARRGRDRRDERAARRDERRKKREGFESYRPRFFYIGRRRKVSMWYLLVFYGAVVALFAPVLFKLYGGEEKAESVFDNREIGSNLPPEEMKARLQDAVQELRQKAEDGHADSQFQLGLILYTGMGVEPDRVQGREWWQKAAGQGHAKAARFLKLYTNTTPPPKDDAEPEVIRVQQEDAEQQGTPLAGDGEDN